MADHAPQPSHDALPEQQAAATPVPAASHRRLFRVLSVVLAIVGALAAGEAAVRVFDIGPDFHTISRWNYRFSENPVLRYELLPGSRIGGSRINSDGMRDRLYPRAKPDGVFRIACVGDSICFGTSVEWSQTFAKRLEELLNEPAAANGHRFEVLNFGVAGYNATQIVELVRIRAMEFEPDLIVYSYCLNDPEEVGFTMEALRDRLTVAERDLLDRVLDGGTGLLAKSRLFNLARYAWQSRTSAGRKRHAGDAQDPMLCWPKGHVDYVASLHESKSSWQRVTTAFSDLAKLAQGHGVPVYLVAFPVLDDLDAYPLTAVHQTVRAAGERAGLHVVDLLNDYQSAARSGRAVAVDLLHPNADGHLIAARAVLRALRSDGVLPPR